MYYINRELNIVTAAPIRESVQYERLCGAIAEVQDVISNLPWALPCSYEIHLQLDADGPRCGYYAVDHERQSEFWFQDVDSYDNLGIDRVSSKHNLGKSPLCSI